MKKPELWETYSDGAVQTRIDYSDAGEAVLARRSEETSELGAWPSPLRALGRGLFFDGLRLADVLQMAPDLHVVQDVERDGERLVTLRGTVSSGELWHLCTVQVNMSRDGRPESIDVHDPFSGALSRRVVVEEYREIEGIWIPVRAMFGGYDLAKGPAGEPVDQQFISTTFGALEPLLRSSLNVAEGARIPTDLSDPSVRAAWARAVHQTVGPEGPYCRPLVLHWMHVDEVVALNDSDRTEARIDAWRLPDDVRVVEDDGNHYISLMASP